MTQKQAYLVEYYSPARDNTYTMILWKTKEEVFIDILSDLAVSASIYTPLSHITTEEEFKKEMPRWT